MKVITIYEICEWNGGDRHLPSGICFGSQEEVEKAIDVKQHDTYRKATYKVYDSAEEYKMSQTEQFKKAALAKLTDLEKKVLGLL